MKFGKFLPLLCLSAFVLVSVQAQTKKKTSIPAELRIEQLPQRPIDTIATEDPDTKIIIYSNNTWAFYRPNLNMDTLSVYRQHWDTANIFAYKSIAHADLPPVVELNLVQTLSEFNTPIMGKVFSKYGPRRRRAHNGVDIPLKTGEPIYATFDGKIRYAKYNTGGYGYLVIVRHANGLETWNAHLSRMNVAVNDYVKAGQIIGYGGNTGRSRGPHLHFEMRYQDQTFDPEFIVDFETGQLKYQTFALEKSFFNIHSRASEILEEEDEFDYPLLADDSDSTSQDILELIAEAQNPERTTAKSSASAPAQAIPAASADAVYHTIKQGDMLGKLSARYGVSIDQICRLNGINRNTILKLGRKLRIK